MLAALLLIGVTDLTINRYLLGSLREARNLKDFLEQTGDYRRLEIYEARRTSGTLSELKQVEEVEQ